MRNLLALLGIFLFSIVTTHAQAIPAAQVTAHTRLTIGAEIGGGGGLGYKLPFIGFLAGGEHAFGNRFEAQAQFGYSPTDKADAIAGNGNTYTLSGTGIVWLRPQQIGLVGSAKESWLRTSHFNKAALYPSAGVIFGFDWMGTAQRMDIHAVFPTGKYDAKTGIEPNRLAGVGWRWEVALTRNLRLLQDGGVYRVLSQGNPFCDGSTGGAVTCPRGHIITGQILVGLLFVWPEIASDRAPW